MSTVFQFTSKSLNWLRNNKCRWSFYPLKVESRAGLTLWPWHPEIGMLPPRAGFGISIWVHFGTSC